MFYEEKDLQTNKSKQLLRFPKKYFSKKNYRKALIVNTKDSYQHKTFKNFTEKGLLKRFF